MDGQKYYKKSAQDFDELAQRIHKNNANKGLNQEGRSNEHILMLVITEFAELVEADRKGRFACRYCFEQEYTDCDSDEKFVELFQKHIKDTLEDEMADVAIRLLDFWGLKEYHITYDFEPWWGESIDGKEVTEIAFKLIGSLVRMKDNVEDAIQLVLAHLFMWAKERGIELWWHVEMKLKYNALRDYKHGGKKY